MPTTRMIEVYKFDELGDEAKEKAREWHREGGFDYNWWEFIFEDADTIAKLIGIEIDRKSVPLMNGKTRQDPAIYFSGFSSQGDGACFEGRYYHKKGAYKEVKKHAPKDQELHRIARELNLLQRKYFYRLAASLKHTGHYNHELSVTIEVEDRETGEEVDQGTVEGVKDALRDFMRWIYKQLEQEWEYMNSDEQVDETIRANEYEFDKDGKRV